MFKPIKHEMMGNNFEVFDQYKWFKIRKCHTLLVEKTIKLIEPQNSTKLNPILLFVWCTLIRPITPEINLSTAHWERSYRIKGQKLNHDWWYTNHTKLRTILIRNGIKSFIFFLKRKTLICISAQSEKWDSNHEKSQVTTGKHFMSTGLPTDPMSVITSPPNLHCARRWFLSWQQDTCTQCTKSNNSLTCFLSSSNSSESSNVMKIYIQRLLISQII